MDILVEHVKLPQVPLSNFDIEDTVRELNIPNFRGVFSRNVLPKKPLKTECGILNFDDSNGNGTHWVAWYKYGNKKYYFDSFGVQPPLELMDYLKKPVYYNSLQIQPMGTVVCGHLCLYVLKKLSKGKNLQDVVNTLF